MGGSGNQRVLSLFNISSGYKSIENPDNSKDFDSIIVYNVSDAELSEETTKEKSSVGGSENNYSKYNPTS